MIDFNVSDAISRGIESGVRMDQFNRDLTQRQIAAEQLAKYRQDDLLLRANQLAEQRRAAMERERQGAADLSIRQTESEADMVTMPGGQRMTSRAASVHNEMNKPTVTVTGPQGTQVPIGAETWFEQTQTTRRAEMNLTASVAARGEDRPFDFDRLDYSAMDPQERDRWKRSLESSKTFDPMSGKEMVPSWAQQQLTRIAVIEAREQAQRRYPISR